MLYIKTQAILFPFFALVIGAATLHILSRFMSSLPYTVVLLTEGVVFTIIQEAVYKGNHDHSTYDSLKVIFKLAFASPPTQLNRRMVTDLKIN